MSDEHPSHHRHKSWFEKLKQLFSNERMCKEDLLDQVRDAEHQDVLDEEVVHIIEGALQVSTMQVRGIMIPRPQMVSISSKETPSEFLPRIIAAGHSRYPVTGDSIDNIIGILLAKDLLPLLLEQEEQPFDLKAILRPAVFVPESKRLNILLRDFRTNKNHMAIVADEYGGVAGLITIEDILEEIVGEIEDEYDAEADAFIKPINQKEFMVKALTPIEDFNLHFNSHLQDEEFETIGGLIMKKLGHMPKHDESVTFQNFCFKVVNADTRRIKLLHVTLLDQS